MCIHAHGVAFRALQLEVYMSTEQIKRTYVAPALERMSIGPTANGGLENSDDGITPNNALPNPSSGS